MFAESRKSTRQSKYGRKMSFTSQMRASAIGENRANQYYSSYNNDPDNVFDPKTGQIHPLYCETVRKCTTKSLVHFGICLQIQQILMVLKTIFGEHGKNMQVFQKIKDRTSILDGIVFIPYLLYKHENCSFLFWILQSSLLVQKFKKARTDRSISLFFNYPQGIITNEKSYGLLRDSRIGLAKKLGYTQQILIYQNPDRVPKGIDAIIQSANKQNEKIVYTESIQKRRIVEFMQLILKKNGKRCFQQVLTINLYILATVFENEGQTELAQILASSANSYFGSQIQTKHDNFIKHTSAGLPKNEKQLENELINNEQQIRKQVKKNIKILKQQKLQKLFEVTFNNIFTSNQQMLLNNRQLIKKQNIELLNQLYEKLLANFDTGRYGLHKDRVGLMVQDFMFFMDQYDNKAVKSSSHFMVFNRFMSQNIGRYYQKLQLLEDQIDQNNKNQNFDDIFDKIEMKKKMLFTLDKEVKQLQIRKYKIQQQNQKLKKLERQLELGRLDTQNQQLFEVGSTKVIKPKISPRTPGLGSVTKSNIMNNRVQRQKTKEKKCWNCCKCSIF